MKLLASFLPAISLLAVPQAFALDSVCDAILKHGIYDKENVLDFQHKYNLSKDVICNSEARSSNYDGSLNYNTITGSASSNQSYSSSYCSSDYDEALSNTLYKKIAQKASNVIASSWSECIRQNNSGVSHYIQPSQDPKRFIYHSQYSPGGEKGFTEVRQWAISPSSDVTCQGDIPKAGDQITASGFSLICTRREADLAVIVVATTTEGGKNLKSVELPPYVSSPVPVPEPEPPTPPTGVVDVTAIWPATGKSAAQKCSTLGEGWSSFSFDGKSDIAYCKKTGTSNRYITDFKGYNTANSNLPCSNTFGNDWERVIWDGKSKTLICKQVRSLAIINTGQASYLKDIGSAWPHECPPTQGRLYKINYSQISFCGTWAKQ